jgi:hypothetical protein
MEELQNEIAGAAESVRSKEGKNCDVEAGSGSVLLRFSRAAVLQLPGRAQRRRHPWLTDEDRHRFRYRGPQSNRPWSP